MLVRKDVTQVRAPVENVRCARCVCVCVGVCVCVCVCVCVELRNIQYVAIVLVCMLCTCMTIERGRKEYYEKDREKRNGRQCT